MNNNVAVTLPSSLLSSDEYEALNESQRNSLQLKIRHCLEIQVKAIEASAMALSLLDAIDDIQLDALSIMSGFGEPKSNVSSYQIHSSWTFECKRQMMVSYVANDVMDFLLSAPLKFDASEKDARTWLRTWSNSLSSSVRSFSKAASFTEVVTHLIIIDGLINSYLVFAAIARMNISIKN